MTIAVNSRYWWHRYTSTESFQRILDGEDPWIAIGDFLDEWKREEVEDRLELVADPLASLVPPPIEQWAAFFAAMVEELCLQDALPVPVWTENERFILEHPWFLYPGWRLKVWQLATTPPSFKKRNIFGGDRMLLRA
jgi:hypothetical protein